MSTTFPIDCYRPAMAEITQTVFGAMLGLTVEQVDAAGDQRPLELTAAVYYAGSWKGALLLECTPEQAARWASHLMSLTGPISTEDARDGLGEVTNMLAGNFKPLLQHGVGLSLPSVVQGSDYRLRICGNNLSARMVFHDGTGPFIVTLVEVPNTD